MNIMMRVAATVAGLAVAGLGVTAAIKAPKPVTVSVPAIVYVQHPCGVYANGCFDASRPNQIEIGPTAQASTIPHEMLHWTLYRDGNPRYGDECYVSGLLALRGIEDTYNAIGWCRDGSATTLGHDQGGL